MITVLLFLHRQTHIDNEGSVADFYGVLWRLTARIVLLPAPTELHKNLPQNVSSSMCVRLKYELFLRHRIFFY